MGEKLMFLSASKSHSKQSRSKFRSLLRICMLGFLFKADLPTRHPPGWEVVLNLQERCQCLLWHHKRVCFLKPHTLAMQWWTYKVRNRLYLFGGKLTTLQLEDNAKMSLLLNMGLESRKYPLTCHVIILLWYHNALRLKARLPVFEMHSFRTSCKRNIAAISFSFSFPVVFLCSVPTFLGRGGDGSLAWTPVSVLMWLPFLMAASLWCL